jgi:tetratricopeptide (TPR) repeat protein
VPRLTVIQLLEALKSQQLSLTDGAIDGPEHHQSLEQALEQSYRLLEYPARILLQALSIFRSAASTGAILAVIRDVEQVPNKSVARLLNMLVDHSLLYRQKSSQKLVRYGMLEPVRQDAMSRLRQGGLGVQLYSGFVMYYVDLVAQAASGLNGSEELYWLAVVDAEIANLEAAWVWALAHNNYDQAAEIIAPIWRYWTIRGLYSTGVMWLERVLAFDSELRIENRAAIRLALAELVSHLGDEQRTHMLLDECLTLYREIPGDIGQIGMAYTLWELHWRSRTEGAIDRARERLNEALLLFKRNNDVWGHIAVLSDLGSLAMACRDLQLARRIFDESLSLAEALANPSLKAICYNNCAWLAREEHDINQAQTMTAACLGLARVLGHNSLEAVQLYCQALVLARQLNYHRAQARIEESIAILEGLGDQRWLAHALTLFADLLWLQGESSLAHGVIQRALAVYQGIGDIHGMVGSLQSVGLICASLGHFQQAEAALLESLAHGTSMDGAEKAVAHTLLCLAYLASEQELWILAAQLTHSSDRMFEQHDCCVEPYLEPVFQRVKSLVDKHATSVTASEANRQIRHAIESYNLDREPHSLAREWRDTSTM